MMESTCKGAQALLRLASVLLLALPAWAVAPVTNCPVVPANRTLPSDATQRRATNDIPGITYNGGPIMTKPINVYLIWYGLDGFTKSQKDILRNLVASFSDSSNDVTSEQALIQGGAPSVRTWWGIETEYYDQNGAHVTSNVRLAREYSDTTASQGTDNPDIGAVVRNAISGGALPTDSNGFYVVFTDPGVYVDGFCTEHCGWHNYQSYNGQALKFAYVGNGAACTRTNYCIVQNPSPNGDAFVDGMASVFAHELAETASDPFLNAWTDSAGENADKCAWQFGTQYDAAKGGKYNLVGKNGMQFSIQMNWDITTGSCQLTPGGKVAVPSAVAI
eukprot:TRINITY_DN11_c0_g1_i1.p1 TRINITY_DN11_c0_g1~~TRINITY_DN11_c0_g1_i1.p1  ORF type:complete len:333 (+),score=53.85 TRINITY_DN11_c0_g1_i1:338-1336(+)